MKYEELERPDFTNGGGYRCIHFHRFVHVLMKML